MSLQILPHPIFVVTFTQDRNTGRVYDSLSNLDLVVQDP
jgi:hypothetical protein